MAVAAANKSAILNRLITRKAKQKALICQAGVAAGYLCAFGSYLQAQEAIRAFMGNEMAAAGRKQALTTLGYYNLRLWDSAWTLSSGLGISYTDNVNPNVSTVGTSVDGGGDLYFTPSVTTRMHWPIATKHSLDLSLGVGYMAYVKHSELDRLFLNASPSIGDLFSFDLNISDNLTINFHERLSLPQYSYYAGASSDPSYSGYANTYALYNSAGASAVWSVNTVPLRAGYEHVNTLYLNSGNSYAPDSQQDMLYLSGGYELKPQRIVGLETGMSILSYGQRPNTSMAYGNYQSGTQYTFGSFYNDHFTEHISGGLHAGYMIFSSDMPVSSAVNSGGGGLYFMVSLSHQLNPHISQTLSGGRSSSLGMYGGNYSSYNASWSVNWNFVEKVTMSTSVAYSISSPMTSQAGSTGDFSTRAVNVSLSRPIMKKLASTFAYTFSSRSGGYQNQINSLQSYTVNTLSLYFSYQF